MFLAQVCYWQVSGTIFFEKISCAGRIGYVSAIPKPGGIFTRLIEFNISHRKKNKIRLNESG